MIGVLIVNGLIPVKSTERKVMKNYFRPTTFKRLLELLTYTRSLPTLELKKQMILKLTHDIDLVVYPLKTSEIVRHGMGWPRIQIHDQSCQQKYNIANSTHWKLNFPRALYLFKANNRNTRKRYKTWSKLTIKTPKWRSWCCSDVSIVNFKHVSHLSL